MKRYALLLLLVAVVSCGSADRRDADLVTAPQSKKDLEKIIKDVNGRAVGSFESNFSFEGAMKKKKYRTLGSIVFTRNPKKMNVSITDFIFKSQLAAVIQDEKDLQIYFPAEKRLFVETMDSFRLKNYSDIDFNFQILYELMTGAIPVLKNYRVVNTVAEPGSDVRYLILENDAYYETISFKGDVPDKILIKDKNSMEKVEFYLEKRTTSGESQFYRTIRIIAPASEITMTVNFTRLKLNEPVKVKSVVEMNLPKNISIIRP